jgi:hypothetical protein
MGVQRPTETLNHRDGPAPAVRNAVLPRTPRPSDVHRRTDRSRALARERHQGGRGDTRRSERSRIPRRGSRRSGTRAPRSARGARYARDRELIRDTGVRHARRTRAARASRWREESGGNRACAALSTATECRGSHHRNEPDSRDPSITCQHTYVRSRRSRDSDRRGSKRGRCRQNTIASRSSAGPSPRHAGRARRSRDRPVGRCSCPASACGCSL